ncbi:type II toxin-antitoxin system RelE/ParE family toxin [Thermopetrobacter sp. TC1]|uniref:type II toxin-antitoxin system RelE family toxin n=1 Tax=Thermopetrobacter sp. TC1 TaxID=1495045 RepID=UPI0009DDEA88
MVYTKEAARQLSKLRKRDQQIAIRIVRVIEAMSLDPFAGDVKRLKNVSSYRRRVGDWRIIFNVFGDTLVVEIIAIDHRRQIYRK